jgi:hypothetical protein
VTFWVSLQPKKRYVLATFIGCAAAVRSGMRDKLKRNDAGLGNRMIRQLNEVSSLGI